MSQSLSQRASIHPPPKSGHAMRYIVIGTLALNVVGFAVYKKVQMRKEAEATAAAASKAAAIEAEAKAAAEPAKDDKVDLARAHRASGLAALETGDYALAVKSFTTSLKLSSKDTDTAELLRIARDLQDRAKDPKRPDAVATESADAAKRAAEASKPVAKAAPAPAKAAPKPAPAPAKRVAATQREEPTETASGTVLVTSTPSGLLVEVDGRSMDLTPAKLRLDPGIHTVVLLRGSTKLHERRIDVNPNGVHSIDVDVTPAIRAERAAQEAVKDEDASDDPSDPRAAAARSGTAPATGAPPANTAAQTRPATTAARPASATPTPAPQAAPSGAVGDVHVASSGIYGDVWINGVSFGPPPVLAKNVAAGTATVEIRVSGSTRRTKNVDVIAGQRTTLRIR